MSCLQEVVILKRLVFLFLGLLLTLPLTGSNTPDLFSTPGGEFFLDGNYEKALDECQKVLTGKAELTAKIQACKVMASSQLALKREEPAKKTIAGMLSLDSGARFSPGYAYPAAVIDLYHTVRIDARVVSTATGEIILTKHVMGEFSGKPEKFLELERELVTALAEGIERIVQANDSPLNLTEMARSYFEAKSRKVKNQNAYVESMFLTAQALHLEEEGNYKAAQKAWKHVQEIAPGSEAAEIRLHILDAFTLNLE